MARRKKKQKPKIESVPQTTSTEREAPVPKSNLKHVKKQRQKQKEASQYTQFIRDVRRQDGPSSSRASRSRLAISSHKSGAKSRPLESFRAIVDAIEDVAVVDVKPGCTGVEFASGENKSKKRNNEKSAVGIQPPVGHEADLPAEAFQLVPGTVIEERYLDTTTSEEESNSDNVCIVDMNSNQGGKSNTTTRSKNQPKTRTSKTSSPSPHHSKNTRRTPSSHEKSSTSAHQSQHKKQKPADSPSTSHQQKKDASSLSSRRTPSSHEKPLTSARQNQRKKQKPADSPSTSRQQKEDAASSSSSEPLPRPRQLSRIQLEDPSALSSSVSSDRSEMESDFSEADLMSAESGDDDVEAVEDAKGEDVTTSYFAPYNKKGYKILPHTIPTHCLILTHPHSVLPFHGQVKMSVLHGEVTVHGCVATTSSAPLVLYSPKSSAALSIETPNKLFKFEKDDTGGREELKQKLQQYFTSNQVEKMVQNVLGMIQEHGVSVVVVESHWSDRTDYVTSFPAYAELFQRPNFKKMWKSSPEDAYEIGFIPIRPNTNTKILTTPPFYHTTTETIMKALRQSGPGRPPIVLVCGWKNVGKSTLVRYLINSMLSSANAVCLLDCDVGQTEFNPPTMLGITRVTKPLLGLPFTHEVKPERMCFFGESSPGSSPSDYMSAVKFLYQYYIMYLQDLPLIINCMGWMKGLGLSLLVDTMRLIEPSHVIQLLPTPEPKNPPILDKKYMQKAKGWSRQCRRALVRRGEWNPEYMLIPTPWKAVEDRKYKAANRRELSLLGYLSQLMPPKLKFHDPQATFDPLPAVEPYSISWKSVAVHVCNADVPPKQMMYALNASVVGLCRADTKKMVPLDSADAENLPKVFQSTPVCECFGLGIIRGIDPVSKKFYILTHLPETTLRDVNTLLKGSLALPKFVLQQGQKKDVPYVTSEFPHGVTGTAAIKVKYMKPMKTKT